MSWLKKICLIFLILLLVLLGTVALLLGTNTGLHFLFNSAARWVPGLQIASVTGGWRDLTLKGVQYEMPGVKVVAGQFHLSLNLSCLKNSRLCVNDIKAQNVDVLVKTNEMTPAAAPETESKPLGRISTPYPIELKQLAIDNLHVAVDDTQINLEHFGTGIEWQEQALKITPTRINNLLIALPKTEPTAIESAVETVKTVQAEPVKTEPEPPLSETLKALFAKPLLASLPVIELPLDIDVTDLQAQQLRLTGDTDVLIDNLQLQASTLGQQVKVARLQVDSPQGNLNLQGQATLEQQWPLALQLNSKLNIDPLKGQEVKLQVDGSLGQQVQLAVDLKGPLVAQLKAETALAQADLPLALTLESKQLRWPLTGDSQYQVNDFRLRLQGKAGDYALSTRAAFQGQDLPPAQLTLDGKGNLEQFNLSRLRLAALQGNTDLTGVVDWSKAISWRTALTLSGINTAKQWPEWPAKLDGSITTRGSLYGGSWQLEVPSLQLKGNVKQNPVSAQGNLKGNAAGQWQIPKLEVLLGRNKLAISGDLAKQWNLDANIDAPNLTGTLPGLAGNAKGSLKLRGDLAAPQLLSDLTASGLQFQALRINRIKLNADVHAGEQIQGQVALRVEQLVQDGLQVKLLTLDAKGSEKQHQLRLVVNGEPVSGQLALDGSFDRATERWRGNLNNTRFDTPVGQWRLSRAIALDYQAALQQISIGPHCWQNPQAELCVPKTIDAGPKGQASVQLNRFDLAILRPFLPEDTQLNGVFSGNADVSWTEKGGLPQAKVALQGKGVKVTQRLQNGALPLAFDTLTLNAALANGRAQLDWLLKISQNGQFSGQVQVADPMGRRNLSGNISINALSLAMLQPILSSGEKVAGMLNANLRLGGNAERPLIYGNLALDKVGINGNWMPFDMTDGRLALNFNGASSTLEGLISTTQGQLNLSGDADWREITAWRARIAAKGDKLRVTVPPMVRLDVSPDLVFEATPQLLSLNGSVDIPWARITVQELPDSAVGISSDEVMLDPQLKPIAKEGTSIPISSNLVIRVGKDVRLDAFGLKARLEGDLKVAQDKKGLGLNGQINIPSGRFSAYGQDLIVQKGQLIFSGPPDQPLLNIEAIRNPDSTENDVKAGVRVTGMADSPKLEIFSDPAMSQQEALSYLLRGQGLDAGGADSNTMTSMLVGIGVAQSGKLVGKIGEAFGVSNLALDTAGVGDSSQVVVSGYVLPGLQVKYGVGIFDSLATLTLRYRLMPKLYLEAVSGLDQALDLLYQFEF